MRKSTWVLVLALVWCHVSNGQETLSQQKPERLYQNALDLMKHHEYGTAYRTFDDFLKVYREQDSRRNDAEYYKALCAISLYHGDGEKQMEDFISTHHRYPKAITAYFDLANFYYNEKNYPKASAYFSKVDFPALSGEQQGNGRFRWGYSLFNQKKLKESLDQFNTIKSQDGQYGPAASYYAGFVELSSGDYANALIDLKRAEANSSYAPIVPLMIANVYYNQKNDDELIRYAEAVLQREDVNSSDEISLLTGEAYYRKRNYQKAAELYKEYLDGRESKSDRGVLFRAGYAGFISGDQDLALNSLKSAASDKDSVGIYASYYLGILYLKRKEPAQALTAFELTRQYKKDKRIAEESLYQSAKINYELGRPDVAIQEFENLLTDFPQSTHGQEVRELLSLAYVNANNYNKAIEHIEGITKRSPAVDAAYQKATYLKGTELFNKEDYSQAIKFFEKSLHYPLDQQVAAEAAFWSGETYSLGGKYEQAIPQYERALSNSAARPSWLGHVRYGLGYAHYNLQHYDKALYSFKEFVAKTPVSDPDYIDALLRLADCYYAGKSYVEALASYKRAVQLNSPDADYARLQSGIILAGLRRYNEASGELDIVSAMPSSRYREDAIFQRGQVDLEQSNYSGAVATLTRLINSTQSSRLLPYALTRRAAAQYNLKKYDQTANDYITVLEKFPTHPVTQDLLLPLQESLNLANRSAEFDKYLSAFKHSNPDAKGIESVEFETAKNLYFNQSYARAIENLSRYAVSYPDSPRVPEAKYYEAESHYRLKEFDKALEIYQQISSDPSFALLSKVVGRVAELEFKRGKYDKAVISYRRLAGMASNKKDEHTAWNGLMESHYLLAQYDSCDVFAHKILEHGSINASAHNKASLYLGKSAMARGNYEVAKDEFLTTLNTARDEHGAEAKYLLGEIFYLTREHKQCIETLLGLNADFAAYEYWVGKSFLLLADNYLAMGNSFQAKGTLKSLVDNFPDAAIRDIAKEKLKAIEEDEAKKAEVKSDTTENER